MLSICSWVFISGKEMGVEKIGLEMDDSARSPHFEAINLTLRITQAR
jgi:hypothetical protein